MKTHIRGPHLDCFRPQGELLVEHVENALTRPTKADRTQRHSGHEGNDKNLTYLTKARLNLKPASVLAL